MAKVMRADCLAWAVKVAKEKANESDSPPEGSLVPLLRIFLWSVQHNVLLY